MKKTTRTEKELKVGINANKWCFQEKIIENLNAEINEMNQIKFDMEKEQSEHSEASKTESIPIETFNEQRVLGKLNFKP